MTTQISAFERNTFENQVIVITGAASGLGKAAAKLIQSRSATVISLDLNKDGLAGATESYQLDVSDQAAVF